jgi:hypothetical protein
MIALETPPDPPLAEPMIIAQSMPKRRPDGFDYVVKDCGQVEHPQKSGWANSLSPTLGLSQLLRVDYEVLKPLVKLDQPPKHGKLMRIAYTRREQLPRSQTSWSTVYSNSDGSLPAVPPDTETVTLSIRVIQACLWPTLQLHLTRNDSYAALQPDESTCGRFSFCKCLSRRHSFFAWTQCRWRRCLPKLVQPNP